MERYSVYPSFSREDFGNLYMKFFFGEAETFVSYLNRVIVFLGYIFS